MELLFDVIKYLGNHFPIKPFDLLILIKDFSLVFIQIAVLVLSVCTLLQAQKISKNSLQLNNELKTVDVMLSCQRKYDELVIEKNKSSIVFSKFSEKTKNYYVRFCNLQFDQWQYYKLNFLKETIYLNWLIRR